MRAGRECRAGHLLTSTEARRRSQPDPNRHSPSVLGMCKRGTAKQEALLRASWDEAGHGLKTRRENRKRWGVQFTARGWQRRAGVWETE